MRVCSISGVVNAVFYGTNLPCEWCEKWVRFANSHSFANSSRTMPALLFEGLTGASVTLCAIYTGVAIMTTKQLVWLQKNSTTGLNTRKLFVMTCLLTSVLRVMSFASMAILDFANEDFNINPSSSVETHDDDNDGPNQDFFNCAFRLCICNRQYTCK